MALGVISDAAMKGGTNWLVGDKRSEEKQKKNGKYALIISAMLLEINK